MKILLISILFIAFILTIVNTTITFDPFSIRIENWHRPIGLCLVLIGLSIYSNGEYNRGKKEIVKYFYEKIHEGEEIKLNE